jgi:outer membrane protein assembly factor BamB
MQRAFLTILFTLVTLTFHSSLMASDVFWPGWLGADRDGRVEYFESPAPWPKRLKEEWSIEVGTGSSMPIVVEGRVYQHARQGSDEVVWCLDIKTGDVLWRKSYRVTYRIQSPGESHGSGPLSNPTWADGRLFTFSVTGILSAWAADSGKLLWRRDYADRFRKTHPSWGHSTSPLVDGNQVVVHFGSDDAGVLVALDVATGEEVWTEGEDGACHASPILVEIQGVRQIVEWNDEAVVGIESQTGRRLWSYSLPHTGSNQNSPTPVFHQGLLLIGGENRGIRSLEPKLENGMWNVAENWHQRRVSLNMASAVVSGDSLYGLSHLKQGQFFRLDAKTGDILWLGPPRMGEYATFLTFPGHIVALRDDTILEIIPAAEDEYRTVASYEVGESPTWVAPVLLTDGVLVKDRTTLFRWGF